MTANRESVVGVLWQRVNRFAVLFVGLLATIKAQADVFHLPSGQTSVQFVLVGNAGNPNDPVSGGLYGDVPYVYNVGKYNVTVAQYAAFLNAVAATDTYSLYNSQMATRANIAGIARSGSSGSYTYSVIGSLNQPVAYVSWGDTARFANWLTNGQPTGTQGPGTTETGSYTLGGATTDAALSAVTRNATAKYVIPTENEWYKAAYYDPTKGGTNYWLYPMRTDNLPFSAMPPGNSAPNAAQAGNFYLDDKTANSFDNGFALTGTTVPDFNQNYLTNVGAYTAASSYYGTFDQGDDLSSWDETIVTGTKFGQRGGSWVGSEGTFRSTYRYSAVPSFEDVAYGMRIALVSAPGDFNGDGVVDAADYVIWRKYDGSDAAGYETWRASFGTPAGSGAAVATVPEPPAALLMIAAVAILALSGHNLINGNCRTGTSRVFGIFILSLIAAVSNVRVAHALTFQLSYDASVASAPTEFLPAFNNAIQFYQTTFTDPITIKLQVGWGTVNNQNMSPGAFGQSLVNGQINSNFGGVKSALIGDAKSATDQTSITHLPATDPTGGAPYLIAYAEAKALGLLPANAPALDGFVGFSKTASFTFDPNNRAVNGKYDFIGVAEHEISEVMGRYGMGQNSGTLGRYSPIDDFRYASPGTLDLAPMNGAYFSIDGGITVINTFKGPGGGDLSDWLGTTIDSYNAGPTIGVENAVSTGDITVMDVIGYDAAGPLVAGDFNGNGVVDAADYVVWRKTDGTPAGYNAWRNHFGQPSGGGSGATANPAVPEPATLVLLMFVAPAGCCIRRRRPA
jgi:sulfatase modifying factor 1